jgi:putative membrane protein insertion efficiency factor
VLAKVAIEAIQYYQRKWSYRFVGACIFEPTCSYYALQAIEKYGFWIGLLKTAKRLSRCRQPNGGTYPRIDPRDIRKAECNEQ